jgi:phage anti-repressor protein
MNELIPINYANENPTVSGRDLHTALEVATPYHIWFPRMTEYGFIEGKSYCTFLYDRSDGKAGKPLTDHALTIGMAKEICMIQRSDKGKRFREYFIECEESWNSPDKIMERALVIAHRRAIEAERRIFALSAENQEMAVALNTSLEYWTVMKYNTETGKRWTMGQCQSIGRRMSAYCRTNGYEIKSCLTGDDRFSSVNSYPLTAWEGFREEAGL